MSAVLRVICRSRLLPTHKYCSIHIASRSFTNEIIWRSITRDATSSKAKTYSFSDVYSKTKALLEQPYEWNFMEETLIAKTESQRKLAPLHVARLLVYLRDLPYDLTKTRSISSLINMYITCYEQFNAINPLHTISDCDEFYKLFGNLMIQQTMAIARVCHGILEKSTDPTNSGIFSVESSGEFVSAFIDQFASGRLALRVISSHNLKLYEQIKNDLPVKTGIFEENCDVMQYIQAAITDSSNDCKQHFSQYAKLKNDKYIVPVECIDKRTNTDGTNFLYIPGHLQMMVFELLKNSMRAIIEKNDKNLKWTEDKIDIVVVDGHDGSVTIKISDQGGGISRNVSQEKIWLYGYTTAFDYLDKEVDHDDNRKGFEDLYLDIIESAEKQWQLDYKKQIKDLNSLFDATVMGGAVKYAPMFGLGYGLPMTKLYSTYFGGDVRLQSVDGYGTDAYLFLNNLSNCNAIMSI